MRDARLEPAVGSRRLVPVATLEVCYDGHVVTEQRQGNEDAWQVLHECGGWTFEDGNYCGHCGKRQDAF